MKVTPLAIPDVLLIEPKVFGDDRGFFLESFHAKRYADVGVVGPFVQDNLSRSVKGTLRGLHFQEPNAQGKLVQCLAGAVWDVAVDIRKGSPTFGRWVAAELTGENKHQLWVPAGLAHGFCVVSDSADFFYKCTALYSPESERSVAWDDPDLAIPWPVKQPLLSAKDQRAPRLKDAPVLPVF
ncbi:dTDP-4-dehydrorhamnose 3,5-epimerase [Corallococcus exiguus]|uniref:dTDP-4-dehydrorhamnose 3,5-epimerase n=1 Tax=Corallococcus TaxID=83461 RepID=UPI000EA20CB2|nr:MULTISPECIES: dTDP-4-dehydrorhamnose 3,5-epimerase [unclassified Corallococcus]MBN8471208.1 dTDP-4-dehydrorhamnose 3,5-epimerase [Corallococcus exiguus]NNC04034.1 dTDP-4-dehydrorhamnose 3,5-epimerase [Corallococcus exiguus]NNC16308.1 dTDP-4-dehydrorhamnose 3,5-epimerase [Corallococcus exiguus]NRD53162.1 dTDP-4-dehydrorhamnose 3,5-epimerase [Corallococcus exiguus]NRD61359.1 dTDP-4-dehydrorhamnose 3,5-epimerase [Corallococcus exiguus]